MSYKGRFIPKHPKKYAGDANNIIWRSTWERKVMDWLDQSESVIYWSSEELVIKYYNPIDNKIHRYFPDFIVKVKRKDGTVMTHVLEVKPEYQTKEPVRKRKTQKFINEYVTYTINMSKWKAATEFCKDRGWEFRILTEKNLGII
ncbi:MAG: head completion protein [Cytophagia bacterium]|jgi:hypothetical protein|nr:head completion protein [Cytophagia bacterium]